MFEETIQTTEQELPDNLFEDETETTPDDTNEDATAEETTEEVTEETTEEATEAKEEQDSPKVKVKYNGEEKEITLDEAVVLAQKGMNYDHVLGEKNAVYDILGDFAKASGMELKDYLNFLNEQRKTIAVEKARTELTGKYKEAPPELLDELAQAKARELEYQTKEQQIKAEQQKAEEQKQAWVKLFNAFPDVKPDAIPSDVYEAVKKGTSPLEAYQAHLLTELQKELAQTKQKQKNKETSVGSVKSTGATEKDPFLDGFYST